MAYADLNTIHNPSTGTIPPATWGDQIRDNFEFLIDPPLCSVYASVAQSVATGGGAVLTADSENFDNAAMHSTVSNTSRITFPIAGRYFINARVQYASGAGNRRLTAFLFNGATTVNADQRGPTGGGFSTIISSFAFYIATAGQYVEVNAAHDVGSNLDVTLLEFAAEFRTR